MKYKYFLNIAYAYCIAFFMVQLMSILILPYFDISFGIKSQTITRVLFLGEQYLGLLWFFLISAWFILIIYVRFQSKNITRSWNGISLLVIFVVGFLTIVESVSVKITNYVMQPVVKIFLEDYHQKQITDFEQKTNINILEKFTKEDWIENDKDKKDYIIWLQSDEFKNFKYRAEIFDNVKKSVLFVMTALFLIFAIIASESLIAIGFILLPVLTAGNLHHILIRNSGTWIFLVFIFLGVINLAIMVYGVYRWNNKFKLKNA